MPKAFLGSLSTTLRGFLEQRLAYHKQKKHKMTVSLVSRQPSNGFSGQTPRNNPYGLKKVLVGQHAMLSWENLVFRSRPKSVLKTSLLLPQLNLGCQHDTNQTPKGMFGGGYLGSQDDTSQTPKGMFGVSHPHHHRYANKRRTPHNRTHICLLYVKRHVNSPGTLQVCMNVKQVIFGFTLITNSIRNMSHT
jgi:hypothetical protein